MLNCCVWLFATRAVGQPVLQSWIFVSGKDSGSAEVSTLASLPEALSKLAQLPLEAIPNLQHATVTNLEARLLALKSVQPKAHAASDSGVATKDKDDKNPSEGEFFVPP